MIYGSLYKVFLQLSSQKNNNKNKYNELTIPKIFVKILLNKDKKNNANRPKLNINNSESILNEDFNSSKIKSKKLIENEQRTIVKNHFMNTFNNSLPKIDYKKDISLIQNKVDSKIIRKNYFSINEMLRKMSNNKINSINTSNNFFKNRFINNFNKIENNIIIEDHRNINDASFGDRKKNVHICNLRYRNKLNKLDEFKDIDDISEIKKNESEDEKIIKINNSNLFNKRNQINKNIGIENLIEKNNNNCNANSNNNNNKFFPKIYSFGGKKKIKLTKIFIKNKINNIRARKSFNFLKNKESLFIDEKEPNKKFNKLEQLDKILSNSEIKFSLNKNLFSDKDIFYFKLTKMYRNQFKEYFSHRINWEIIKGNNYNNDITINFEWKYYSNKLNYKDYKYDSSLPINKLKIVNLFERNYEIGNKKNMFINLINYCDKENINVFEIVPFTMIINNSNYLDIALDKIEKIMKFVEKNKHNKNNILSKQKYNEIFDEDKFFETLKNQYIYIDKNFLSSKNYWIIKPPDLYQGKCIEICNSFDELVKIAKNIFKGVDKKLIPEQLSNISNYDYPDENKNSLTMNNFNNNNAYNNTINYNNARKKIMKSRMYCSNEIIIQKYLDNPLLYKNRKFDIRCFVLLDSNFNLYFCREGHLKGSSELYNLNNSNKYIHITNYSLQKNSNNFELYEIGNEMSYKDFKNFLINENISLEKFDYMINQMKILIKISFKSVAKKLLKEKQGSVLCFEIFGYDFILDNDFKLWILEINNNPGLSISSPVIEKLIPRMMDDAFRLTIDKIFNTRYSNECIDEEGKYKTKYKLNGFRDDENIFEFLCNINI